MIKINCDVPLSVPFTELLPFQGALKASKEEEIHDLAASLLIDGLVTPFFVWHRPDLPDDSQPNYVIDGHRRLLAIQYIAQTAIDVLKQSYPVVIIRAETADEAKKQLLLICSTYGKITPKGLKAFLTDSPSIKLEEVKIKVTPPSVRIKKEKKAFTIVRIKLPTEKLDAFFEAMGKVSYVEVL